MTIPDADQVVLYVLAAKGLLDTLSDIGVSALRLCASRWREVREILGAAAGPRDEHKAKLIRSTSGMALKTCNVTITDAAGVRHTAEVTAESLFEAAAMGLAALKKDGWTGTIGPAARLEVEVREAVVRHTLTVPQIERWLQGATTSPNERVRKDRLRALLQTSSLHPVSRP